MADVKEGLPVLNLNKKRPPKKESINFILNQWAAIKAKVPGATLENVKYQIAFGNYYLYESEVKEIVDEKKKEEGFDPQGFINLLKAAGCVKQGNTPAAGQSQTHIDSIERAQEVAVKQEDAVKVQAIMAKITALREELNPLIKGKATLSVALKNDKPAEKKKDEKSKEDVKDKTK